jgi:hypothetical protein
LERRGLPRQTRHHPTSLSPHPGRSLLTTRSQVAPAPPSSPAMRLEENRLSCEFSVVVSVLAGAFQGLPTIDACPGCPQDSPERTGRERQCQQSSEPACLPLSPWWFTLVWSSYNVLAFWFSCHESSAMWHEGLERPRYRHHCLRHCCHVDGILFLVGHHVPRGLIVTCSD